MTAEPGKATWSNPSVLQFAAGGDPLTVASRAGAGLYQVAEKAGFAGPPLDVIGLARHLGIVLRPTADGWDARVSELDSRTSDEVVGDPQFAGLVIDYDPSRPRGRMRFSIAHELAHACFPDVRNKPRHRTAQGAVQESADSDEWELELLCNVIAAELLVPQHAVEGLFDVSFDIDFVMEVRRRWDVSTEALLRRFVAGVPRPMILVSAARTRGSAMRVDYSLQSKSVQSNLPLLRHGRLIDNADVLLSCVAVGQTVRGTITIDGAQFPVQAVGLPPYPGSVSPRVMAVIEPEPIEEAHPNLAYTSGDIVELPSDPHPIVIAHVVSDSVRGWTRNGAAGAIGRAFPDFAGAYRAWTIADPTNLQLGNVHSLGREVGGRLVEVVSLVAQHGYGPGEGTRLRYDALDEALERVAPIALRVNAEVHVPRLGAGRAGGRWDVIEQLLIRRLADRGVRVVVHTLPSPANGGR
jgi:hypothetical protein